MAINSYFYDSVANDRPYSAADFSRAFEVAFENGIFAKNTSGALGFDIGGVNYTTIYAGKAVIEGHLVEVTDTETLVVPAGVHLGQIVIKVEMEDARKASIIVKTERTPIQSGSIFELPLYNATIEEGIITSVIDVRSRGGAVPNNHFHSMTDVTNLNETMLQKVTWFERDNGVYLQVGAYSIALTPAQPPASAKRVWIQIDN